MGRFMTESCTQPRPEVVEQLAPAAEDGLLALLAGRLVADVVEGERLAEQPLLLSDPVLVHERSYPMAPYTSRAARRRLRFSAMRSVSCRSCSAMRRPRDLARLGAGEGFTRGPALGLPLELLDMALRPFRQPRAGRVGRPSRT